jgi:hypothetical protein
MARGPLDRLLAWWRAEAVAQVPGIVVAIENSTTVATTDTDGFFRLEGNQFGPSVVHFTGDGADARLPLKLPSGGEVDLIDVDLNGAEITVAQQQIHFDGPITGIDCGRNLLQVLSGERVPFRLHLQPGTSIVDDNGLQLLCGDLETGRQAEVRGTIDSRGDVDPTSIRVGEEPTATPTPRATATPTPTARPTGTPR